MPILQHRDIKRRPRKAKPKTTINKKIDLDALETKTKWICEKLQSNDKYFKLDF